MKKLALSRAKEWQDTTPEQLRDRLPIRVISLARIHARRQTVLTHLQAAGIRFEVFDAIDGKNASPIFDSTVAKYIQGIRLDLWKRQHPHHRKKVAVDISHYVNLHRISKEGQPALIIEDDARIPSTLPSTRWDSVEPAVGNSSHAGRWYAALLAALQELPEDWDVLYPAMCWEEVGATIRGRVQIVKGGACTLGYLASPRFANAVLAELRRTKSLRRGPVVDGLYQDLFKHWEVAAYITTPRLLERHDVPSELSYREREANLTEDEVMWVTLHEGTGAWTSLKRLP